MSSKWRRSVIVSGTFFMYEFFGHAFKKKKQKSILLENQARLGTICVGANCSLNILDHNQMRSAIYKPSLLKFGYCSSKLCYKMTR